MAPLKAKFKILPDYLKKGDIFRRKDGIHYIFQEFIANSETTLLANVIKKEDGSKKVTRFTKGIPVELVNGDKPD